VYCGRGLILGNIHSCHDVFCIQPDPLYKSDKEKRHYDNASMVGYAIPNPDLRFEILKQPGEFGASEPYVHCDL